MELQRDRLLLIDAIIELNEALLLGIKASLDSLNVDDTNTDPKNTQAAVRKMQRQRDKIMLIPEFLHMQDSLNTDIVALKKQKTEIEIILLASIQNPASKNISQPVAQNGTIKETATVERLKKEDVAAKTKKDEKRNRKRQLAIIDTLVIVDVKEPDKGSAPVASARTKTKKSDKKKPEIIAPVRVPDTVIVLMDSSLIPLIPEMPMYSQAVALPEDTSLLNLKDSEQQYFDDSINHIRAEYFLTLARRHINHKNYKQAEDNLKKAIAQQPDYYDARFAKAEVEALTGQNEKALADYKLCLNNNHTSAQLLYRIGEVLLALKQNGEAAGYFERSLKVDSNYVPAMMVRADFLTDVGRYTEAIAICNRVLTLNIGYHTAYKTRGIAQVGKKEYAAAISDLTRYLIFKENDAAAYYYRGLAKAGRKEKSAACLDLNTALQLGDHDAKKEIDRICGR